MMLFVPTAVCALMSPSFEIASLEKKAPRAHVDRLDDLLFWVLRCFLYVLQGALGLEERLLAENLLGRRRSFLWWHFAN
jgi:hypothetical protein